MPATAVLLVNLGSPDSPSEPDVRRYLEEFLSDDRVLDLPKPLQQLILRGMILPFRPRRSAHAYRQIWTDEGSPLLRISESVRARLAGELDVPVLLAMRYGNPSIRGALRQARTLGVERLFVIPLYPHYAMSSYETVVHRVEELAVNQTPEIGLDFLAPFFGHPEYIDALVESAADALSAGFDHLLFSYHGIPVRHLRKADASGVHCCVAADCCSTPAPARTTCYRAQCLRTTEAFVGRARVDPDRVSIAYQSRLAGEPWLKPYTDKELVRLAEAGVRRLVVMTPAFVSDCLETLEEVAMAGRDAFLAAGGESFAHVPCLNDRPSWIAFLAGRVNEWAEAQRRRGDGDGGSAVSPSHVA